MTLLVFLGTGGGRFATIFQARATGGIVVLDGDARMHIDPGPGALVRCHEANLDPTQMTALLVSHAHPDHCNDVNIMVEAMTRGGTTQRGELLGSRSVVEGVDNYGPVLSRHHRGKLANVMVAEPGKAVRIRDREVVPVAMTHSDPSTVGFRIRTTQGEIAYVTDTAPKKEIFEEVRGCRVLVLGVTKPRGEGIPGHLATEHAIEAARIVQPEMLVITHLGLRILRRGPEREAESVTTETGVRTVAVKDRSRVKLTKEAVLVRHPKPRGARRHER